MEYISITLSITAFLISIAGFWENRRNNRISKAPAIVGHESEGEAEYSYAIKNKGNGPAFFEQVECFLNGISLGEKPLRVAISELLGSHKIRYKLSVTNLGNQCVMAAGEEMVLVSVSVATEDIEKFKAISAAQFGIRIRYKSGHGVGFVWATNEGLR